MPLQPGARLGPYEIISPLGAGGMGEVYRGRDTRLDRVVAIKILPDHLSSQPDLRQRFEREARTVSSLNHPHICTVHDIGHQNGSDYLVMEYLEGETLAARLHKGPLSTSELLQYAIQIADALDRAHKHGIVHRDLKPGNIMITKAGAKLLDFGLAKSTTQKLESAASDMATVSGPLTEKGTLLGTVAYMSPEQLEGKDADSRSDIFAFGAVLYEMASGKRAFQGKSQASLISAIMSSDPPSLTSIQPMTPPALDQLVRTCLSKDPEERFQNAHDLMLELRWIDAAGSQASMPGSVVRRRRWAWIAIAAGALLLGAALGYFLPRKSTIATAEFPVRSILPLPVGMRLSGWASPVVAFSADGRKVAFVAEDEGGLDQLYVRQLDQSNSELVPNSEEAEGPFFSPDNQWVGFAVGVSGGRLKSELKKFSLSTHLTQSICDIQDYFGATWGNDGNILFVNDGQGLWKVRESGGKAERFVDKFRIAGIESSAFLLWPQLLPGGKHVLLSLESGRKGSDLAILELGKSDLKELPLSAVYARYASSGHLLYARPDATLMAVPFDTQKMEVTGSSVAILKEICLSGNAAAVFAASETGALAYVSGYLRGSGRELSNLVTIDRQGKIQPLPLEEDLFGREPTISSDLKRLAVPTWDGSLWVYDLLRRTRIMSTNGNEYAADYPIWTPDGKTIAFAASHRGGGNIDIYWQAAGGVGKPQLLVSDEAEKHPQAWVNDGKTLVYESFGGNNVYQNSLSLFSIGGNEKPKMLMGAEHGIRHPAISPDEHWLAYVSTESGKFEVYVQKFPELGDKVQISVGGGLSPHWSNSGQELIYRNGDRFFAVPITTKPDFQAGAPQLLFEAKEIRGFDVAPDGTFYATRRIPDSGIQTQIQLVTNWFSELERLAPRSRN